MNRPLFARALVALCFVGTACGKSGAGDVRSKWLAAKLVPTAAETKGVKLHVDIPEGLPENKESIVGPDWMVKPVGEAGPRIGISLREKTFKTPEDLAREVEPDAKRADLVEVSKLDQGGGRLQYVSAVKNNRHLDVTVWIPTDETHGLEASCHWYSGPDDKKSTDKPDAELIAWLTKICDSIKLGS
ncbi:MAG TPA: hypothetical protein VFV99_16745 [Kofleriaceae bacterium]|nr:hypothetical protein [Kofleriaceae bacterium]